MDHDNLLLTLRKMCDKAGGQAAWAASAKLSAPYVSDVLNKRRDPGDALLAAMGFVKIVDYRRIGRGAKSET